MPNLEEILTSCKFRMLERILWWFRVLCVMVVSAARVIVVSTTLNHQIGA